MGGHPLFKIKEVRVSTVKLDVLHTLDLGVAAYMHWLNLGGNHEYLWWQKLLGLTSVFSTLGEKQALSPCMRSSAKTAQEKPTSKL